jgi:hypothetical protein
MIKKAMGRGQMGDRGFYNGVICVIINDKDDTFRVDGKTIKEEDMVFIPQIIDDSSPEASKRSLWGMLDWIEYSLGFTENNGNIEIIKLHGERFDTGLLPPTEAILKALCHQEGVGVK